MIVFEIFFKIDDDNIIKIVLINDRRIIINEIESSIVIEEI